MAGAILIQALILVETEEKFPSRGSTTFTVDWRGSYLGEPVAQSAILLELRVMTTMSQGYGLIGFLIACE